MHLKHPSRYIHTTPTHNTYIHTYINTYWESNDEAPHIFVRKWVNVSLRIRPAYPRGNTVLLNRRLGGPDCWSGPGTTNVLPLAHQFPFCVCFVGPIKEEELLRFFILFGIKHNAEIH
jgi:hypothetical protein